MTRLFPSLALAVALVALGGCNRQADQNTAASGNSLDNVTDPVLAAALHDQIMVDPGLTQQANGDAVRPPTRPYSAATPAVGVAANTDPVDDGKLLQAPAPSGRCDACGTAQQARTLGGLAARQRNPKIAGCPDIRYSATWANRLPPDLPLYPRAQVTEAAGSSGNGCSLRVVSFTVARPMDAMIDWYYTRLTQAGYSAEHQSDGRQHVLGGTRQKDDGAYVLWFTARKDGGTDIDLVTNNGV